MLKHAQNAAICAYKYPRGTRSTENDHYYVKLSTSTVVLPLGSVSDFEGTAAETASRDFTLIVLLHVDSNS